MRVFILGHRGMLGHVTARFFQQSGFEVALSERRFESACAEAFVQEVANAKPDWCINCVGVGPNIKSPLSRMREANTDLPLACARLLPKYVRLIHASTDAVFNPLKPKRLPSEGPDSTDEYGTQKRQAEAGVLSAGNIVIRTSIVGPDSGAARNLLQWVLTHPREKPIPGFVNQMWNGITSLEWAKVAMRIVQGDISLPLLQPAFLPAITKFELIRMIRDIWQLPCAVVESSATVNITRCLLPNIPVPPINDQLNELRNWY
jgi:dTDP-4-dehydrorhamnose reductase